MSSMVSLISVVHPWMCDEFLHLNRRHYAAIFDDATLVVLKHLDAEDRSEKLGWADVRTETDFKAEARSGNILRVTSNIEKIGRSSLSILHTMRIGDTGVVAAVEKCISVRFDLEARVSTTLSHSIVEKARVIAGDGVSGT